MSHHCRLKTAHCSNRVDVSNTPLCWHCLVTHLPLAHEGSIGQLPHPFIAFDQKIQLIFEHVPPNMPALLLPWS